MSDTPTDPREIKPVKLFLVTMRERQNDGATETVSFRSGIYVSQSEAHAKVAMLESRQSGFAVDELDAKPFDTTFLTAQLESTNSKLAAEVERLKTACEKEFQSVEQLSGENMKLAAEIAELRKRAHNVSQEEANELQTILRTLAPSGRAFVNSARQLVELWEKGRTELETAKLTLFQTEKRLDDKLRTALADKDAAEKRADELRLLLVTSGIPIPSALTPAPTQEPPAGGVLESKNDYPGVELGSAIINVDTGELVSPADVPSEGRGECPMCHGFGWIRIGDPGLRCQCKTRLPFNLSDALAGKPVVTRLGYPLTEIKSTSSRRGTLIEAQITDRNGTWKSVWWGDGKYNAEGDSEYDLFMLPTEGSGA